MAGFLFTVSIAAGPSDAPAQSVAEGREALAGIWGLNRERSDVPGDTARGAGGDPGPPGGKVIIGRGGGGGGGGVRIGGPGGGARGGSPEQMQALANYLRGRFVYSLQRRRVPEQMQALANYLRGLNEPSERLTIVVDESSVGVTSADGRTELLQTDNKKVQGRAENGLVKFSRRSRWDGHTLVAEIDIDGGPRIRRRYELAASGTALHISTETRGGAGPGMRRSGGADQARALVYNRPNAFDSTPAAHVGSSGSRDQ